MTAPTVADIMALMEALAPAALAEEWDNVGLQAGSRDWPARKVRLALDPLPAVVEAAARDGVGLLVTHHPLIFRPLRQLDFDTPAGKAVEAAARNQMAIFAAHTNLDSVAGGVNDALAERIGLSPEGPMVPAEGSPDAGIGRLGRLAEPEPLDGLARRVGRAVGTGHVRVVGDPASPVTSVAICSGSGGGLLTQFLNSPARCYVTGDLKYHEARDIEAAGRSAVDVGHFASEHLAVAALARALSARLAELGAPVPVDIAAEEREPFRTLAVNGATNL
jgi:dinuclear metal center YbgI/SA1388 family protein